MLRSLTAAGIRPDLVVGASVGALNGVFYAARPDPDGVEELADAGDGQSVPLSHGPALPALMASIAIPAVYPPVQIDGRTLIDGGVAGRTVLDRAVDLGADEVYLLTPGFSCQPPRTPSTALAMGLHAYNLLAPAARGCLGRAAQSGGPATPPAAAVPGGGAPGRLSPDRRADRAGHAVHRLLARTRPLRPAPLPVQPPPGGHYRKQVASLWPDSIGCHVRCAGLDPAPTARPMAASVFERVAGGFGYQFAGSCDPREFDRSPVASTLE